MRKEKRARLWIQWVSRFLPACLLALCLLPSAPAEEDFDPFRTVGNVVSFGRYEQDGEEANGPEEIEWIVLDVREGKCLLLSQYGLAAKPFNQASKSVTWEDCTLREWLNGDFLQAAFTPAERAAIPATDVPNDAAQGFGGWKTGGEPNTRDRVFLLSCAEANRYLQVTDKDTGNVAARVSPTETALQNGAWTAGNNQTEDGEDAGWWWLRSPGKNRGTAAFVRNFGSLSYTGVGNGEGCVRPALWLDPDLLAAGE